MKKLNTISNRFPAHLSAVMFLGGFSQKWEDTRTVLMTTSLVLRETYFLENIWDIIVSFTDVAKLFGLSDTAFVKTTVSALEWLDYENSVDDIMAELKHTSFHDVIMHEITGIKTIECDAPVQLRTLLGFLDLTEVPRKSIPLLLAIIGYKAKQIGASDKAWVIGPLVRLQNCIVAMDGHGNSVLDDIIGDETHPIEVDGAEVAGEGGVAT